MSSTPSSTAVETKKKKPKIIIDDNHPLILTLRKIDPILQFLTKATGEASIPLSAIRRTIPAAFVSTVEDEVSFFNDVIQLASIGVLHFDIIEAENSGPTTKNINEHLNGGDNGSDTGNVCDDNTASYDSPTVPASWNDATYKLGFPPPAPEQQRQHDHASRPKQHNIREGIGTLHGSTKSAAQRRLTALKRILKKKTEPDHQLNEQQLPVEGNNDNATNDYHGNSTIVNDDEVENKQQRGSNSIKKTLPTTDNVSPDEIDAHNALLRIFGFQDYEDDDDDDDDDYNFHNVIDGIETSNKMIQSNKNGMAEKRQRNIVVVDKDAIPCRILKRQAAYAGSNPAQKSLYGILPPECLDKIPMALLEAFGVMMTEDNSTSSSSGMTKNSSMRQLFRHQTVAITAAVAGKHVSVCTGTGSGKSLCFLIPALSAAYHENCVSLLLYPTKALAQDQLSKLRSMLSDSNNTDLMERIRPMTLDGDTSHGTRGMVAETANIILTNPDTLHAAILPYWKTKQYTHMLSSLRYVVLDEAHMYEGVFGAHVALILRRLVRCAYAAAATAASESVTNDTVDRPMAMPIFIATSATLPHPENHFRQLCPIGNKTPVVVLSSSDDTSPRSAKHFFVWNPPILRVDGTGTGYVDFPHTVASESMKSTVTPVVSGKKRKRAPQVTPSDHEATNSPTETIEPIDIPIEIYTGECTEKNALDIAKQYRRGNHHGNRKYYRQHAAEETALLLALAVSKGVRCIAFCKTRNVVEWVYSRTIDALKKNMRTAHLADKVESYRGGYSMMERRMIEKRLFTNDVLAVVGTNALELGVDIGGIDLTLHCGYPTSYSSLLQQAGRAGRGKDKDCLEIPSLSIVVCFNSPAEQHIWHRPKTLLGQAIASPSLIPFTLSIVRSHMLCASDEFPLTGRLPISAILGSTPKPVTEGVDGEDRKLLRDFDLFVSDLYDTALQSLIASNSVVEELIPMVEYPGRATVGVSIFKACPSARKLSACVSIRSIEPVNFSLINLAHPGQGGRMDGLHDDNALMDILPYSRVFYEAHPGAIIRHRARKYKIVSMTRPPPYIAENFNCRRSYNLAAYAKPTNARYITRPLSNLHITVVKQMESVELPGPSNVGLDSPMDDEKHSAGIATCNNSTCQQLVPLPLDANNNYPGDPVSHGGSHTLVGCGVVNVKRTVRGYKKLSLINYSEISRQELILPPIEYETFGLYICLDLLTLRPLLGESFGPGVHALSHALLAVAPLFAPGLVRGDVDCDHSYFEPTQIMLFDERAGGSGSVARLWNSFFDPNNNILVSAIELLQECTFCRLEREYDGGCPSCLHASNCMKFNMELSRSAAIVIGKSTMNLIKRTKLYQNNFKLSKSDQPYFSPDTSPRRKARDLAVQRAKDMHAASERQFVIGRPTWPLDE